MALGNMTSLAGNASRSPELRFTPGGMAVAQFGLAVNRRRKDRGSDEWKDEVSFFDVVCYGTLAENVAESIVKGSRVIVQGRLEQRSWETQDGDKRSKVEVVADEIGPSLRWATAEITKNEKRSDGGGAGGSGFTRPANRAPASDYDVDEEPFVLDVFDGADRYAPRHEEVDPMITIYGHSDDLIEVIGDVDEEFAAYGDDPFYVGCSNGALLRVTFTESGVWRIVPVVAHPSVSIVLAPEDDEDTYSDRATVDADVSWVTVGWSMAKAKK